MLVKEELEGGKTLFDRTYRIVVDSARRSGGLVIFVATDVDALCACHIWTALLKADQVAHRVVPVLGYEDLALAARAELRACVGLFLNCGGTVDLPRLLAVPPELTLVVVDAHRPLHLANVASTQVFVLYDGDPDYMASMVAAGMVQPAAATRGSSPELGGSNPAPGVDAMAAADAADRGGGDEEDAERELDDVEDDALEEEPSDPAAAAALALDAAPLRRLVDAAGPQFYRFLGNAAAAAGSSASGVAAPPVGPDGAPSPEADDDVLRRRLSAHVERALRATYAVRAPPREEAYYRAATGECGMSAACVAYRVAAQLSLHPPWFQWMATVGLTDQLVHARISPERYERERAFLAREVGLHAPAPGAAAGGVGGGGGADADAEAAAPASAASDQVVPMDEFRFFLMRYWTLYDAVCNSTYMATRFAVWKDAGRARLHLALAKAGIALVDAQQRFSSMTRSSRAMLHDAFRAQLAELGCDDVLLPSFAFRRQFRAEVSALDAVHSAAALLQTAADSDDARGWRDQFWVAHDWLAGGLYGDSSARGADGFAAAQRLQETVIFHGAAVIERSLIVQHGPFRYAFVPDGLDQRLFVHPHALYALAQFLAEHLRVQQQRARRARDKPLLVCAVHERAAQALLVSVPSLYGFSASFALAFRRASARVHAHVLYRDFGVGVIALRRTDLRRFMELLMVHLSNGAPPSAAAGDAVGTRPRRRP